MNLKRDIQPISNLKRQSAKLLEQLAESSDPIILTKNGQPCIVVQEAGAYQELFELKEKYDAMIKVRQGLEDVKQKRTRPADEVFEELEKNYAL